MAKPQRAFALVAALLLLVSSVGFSGFVIWQMTHQPDTSTASQASTDEVLQQLQQQQQGGTKLEGTKLANYTPVAMVNELQSIDIKEGTGETVQPGASVVAHYTGALAKDGTIFQSSKDFGQPIPFSLNGVIEGWQKGVPGMKVGGVRRLIIPAAMAYGEAGSPPSIGPNEPLVFDIELTSLGQ